jgi:hypothetical protein
MLKKLFQQSRLARYLILLPFLFSIFLGFQPGVFAQEKKEAFVTIVNPVRGKDFWSKDFSPLEPVKGQYEAILAKNLPATWLLRSDAFSDPEISNFFKGLAKNQELGIFFEITPSLCQAANVTYNQSDSWHKAKSVFLTGYSVEDRKKLITSAFEKFKQIFGYYPKSVGAWWIDANSLSFMKEKYGVSASLVVADQFSTDDYQIWGLYWGVPYYPAKKNGLVPAQSKDSKIGVVQIQWALRDPFNAYGPGVQESTYSVQPNDYITAHDLDVSYFEKLFDIYTNPPAPPQFGQITIGLENDFPWPQFQGEYQNQLKVVEKKMKEGKVRAQTMSEFSEWYRVKFPDISPSHLIATQDPLGQEGQVVWFMTSYYRVGWFYHSTLFGSAIRDLRVYNDSLPEPCYAVSCANLDLGLFVSKPLDEATFGDRWTIDEGKISDFKLSQINRDLLISYKNQAGKERSLEFREKDLFLDGEGTTVPQAIMRVLNQPQKVPGKIAFNFQGKSLLKNWFVFSYHGLLYLLFVLGAFLLPALSLFKFLRLNFSPLEKIVLGTICGLSLFTLAAFIFGYLKIGFLLAPAFFSISFLYLYQERKNFRFPKILASPRYFLLALLLFFGVLTQGLTVFKSGLPFDFGLGFWGPNGHDGIWHLSIISELKNHFPPQNPVLSGVPLKNYHYFSDLVIAQIAKILPISVLDLYFRFFPALISLLFGLVVFILVRQITRSEAASLLAVFISYFGGGFGWIVNLLREGKLGGESMFWATGSVSFLLNPPFALSVVIFLAGLLLFYQFFQNKIVGFHTIGFHTRGGLGSHSGSMHLKSILLISVLWGSLIQFKAYAGVLVLASLAIVGIWELVFKRTFNFLKILVPIALISALVFLPNNFESSNLLAFSPFWFIHTMVDYQDRFYWQRLSNARTAYVQMGWWWKFILAEILGFLIFFFGNLGIRFLALGAVLSWIKSKFKIDPFWLFVATFFFLGLLIPLIFIQMGTPWNTIQFFYYSLYLANILAAIVFWQIIKNWPKLLQFVVIAIFCIVTIPTTLGTLYYHYLPSRPPARLSFGELEALEFLKGQPHGIVLARAYDEKLRDKFDLPLPLFVYETSAYISAFSQKTEFVADEVNLEIIGVSYKDRVIGTKEFFRTRDENFARDFLRKNNIKYIYVTKFERWDPNEKSLDIKKIFENDEVKVYQVL